MEVLDAKRKDIELAQLEESSKKQCTLDKLEVIVRMQHKCDHLSNTIITMQEELHAI